MLAKQIETVFRLLAELKKTKFIIKGEHATLLLFLDLLHRKYWENYKDKELFFSMKYMKELNPIWKITEDIFLPKEIAEKMSPLIISVIESCDNNNGQMKVSVLGDGDDKEMFAILNQTPITLNDYVVLWDDVIKTSVIWLKKHSDVQVELNFNRSE